MTNHSKMSWSWRLSHHPYLLPSTHTSIAGYVRYRIRLLSIRCKLLGFELLSSTDKYIQLIGTIFDVRLVMVAGGKIRVETNFECNRYRNDGESQKQGTC